MSVIEKCWWDHSTECRHQEWFKTAQEFLDSTNMSIPETIIAVEQQYERLKEGCKLCIHAEIARQLMLISARGQ